MIKLFEPTVDVEAATEAVRQVLLSKQLAEGPKVAEFEEALQYFMPWAGSSPVAVNSATSGLELVYHLLDLGPGDEVISTPMTCAATNVPLLRRGVKIVWADVDPRTGNIDPASVAALHTDETKAVVAVDWGGRPCDWEALRKAAPSTPIVEDAAHALGLTSAHGGDFIVFSFQAIKHLTTGDGGAVFTRGLHANTRLRQWRWYGMDRTETRMARDVIQPGFKMHMNDLAAAIGLANIPVALEGLHTRRVNARAYRDGLQRLLHVKPPPAAPPECPWWLFTLLVDDREACIKALAETGIEASPVHRRNDEHAAFGGRLADADYPGLAEFSRKALAIPVGLNVTPRGCQKVIDAIRRWDMRRD